MKPMKYELTDEMFEAFGKGKLKIDRVEGTTRKFRVAYDSMVINLALKRIEFRWKEIPVAMLSFDDLNVGSMDTLTIMELDGTLPFKLC